MSRYELCGRFPHIALVVGWDRPLATFFAQVWDKRCVDIETQDDDGEWLLWVGCEWGEIRSVEQLASLLSAYVELPSEVRDQLQRDAASNTV